MRGYHADCRQEEGGRWVATLREFDDRQVRARSVRQLRNRVIRALAEYIEDADVANVIEDLGIPKHLVKAIQRYEIAREKRHRARLTEEEVLRAAIYGLAVEHGLAARDVAFLLTVSHRQVEKVARDETAMRELDASEVKRPSRSRQLAS